MQLQLRSAISHLNEVWAIEAGGVILSAFAYVLPWEWIHDSARWTYDESRHCQMGYERLMAWGLEPAEIPLGTYIYESAAGEDPIYLLGMLYFFETKNIRHKPARAQLFHSYGDALASTTWTSIGPTKPCMRGTANNGSKNYSPLGARILRLTIKSGNAVKNWSGIT